MSSFTSLYTKSINFCVQDVIQLLEQSESPLLIGIWGMAGIGKSTIAKTIYDQIGPYFENKCFLKNIRGVWGKINGQVSLQQKLLYDINKSIEVKIPTIESGRGILKERLQHKRVLLVLDGVDKLEQLEALCGSSEWFGEGSKIIIVTRDRHLLKEHGVDHIYRVKHLDKSESLEVFNWSAFRETTPKDFVELSRQIVAYSGGLPLALKALGRLLHQKDVLEWKLVLKSLERFSFPEQEVLQALQKSYIDLSDEQKQIFLDIACFFNGMDQNDVLHTLNRSTQSAALQIRLLEDKSLLTIEENNKLEVHVLLQAMARDIIKRESSNMPDQQKRYDVFLSFRGENNQAKFVSHLCSSLENAGVYVFRDNEIQRGDQISMSLSLLRAIGRSRIAIVVLSKNYAKSRWCMLELEKIMEIGRVKGSVVVPVFYEIDPSQVRHQKDQFGKGFDDLISTISVDESTKSNWRRELFDIGGIAGFVLIDSRNESDDIKNIVSCVTRLLDGKALFVAEHPVGVESRVQAVVNLLNMQKSEDVLLIGIWGRWGTGKTTIAKAIYNQIGSKFEGRSFLVDIREFWETNSDQVSLQQQVPCDGSETKTFKIYDHESEKNTLKKRRIAHSRVLFVLDDVNELDQVKALCGSRKWFGPGSRIIITTRDLNLLKSCGVDEVYKIEEMNESESVELFSWHAFRQPRPAEDFATHSKDMIACLGGLPLALEVLGSYLSDCEITEWHNVLEKLKCIPRDQIQKKLKVIYEESNSEKRSRLWRHTEVFDILSKHKGTEFVKGLALEFLRKDYLKTKASKKMNKLKGRFVWNRTCLAGVKLKGDFKYLLRDLKWQYWHGFPESYVPAEYSQLKKMGNKNQMYDVFLSFRGKDNRARFISHLHASLQNMKIYAFKDDDEIQRGDQISISLLQAIERSRIAIVVLSPNYANSRWCMLELEKIMGIAKAKGLVVVPVFYEVDPSEVRHQKGLFGKAFEELISTISLDDFKKSNWRRQLFDVGGIDGFVLIDSRNESADIKNIVEHVTRLLDMPELFVAEHPVALESRVKSATKLLNMQNSEDVLILGIWGMGGVGKTTIAKAIYNEIGISFEGRSFLFNIREAWETNTNQVSLQQQVLCDVYKTLTLKIQDIEAGKKILKERLAQKKVLLVLDDVNELDQLRALCGSRGWFGPGSRIIIITRDMHLLRSFRVDEMYKIEEMDECESLELFSWHAFKQPCPIENFATHAKNVIAYSGRLPLALEVLGSYLADREITEWQTVLEKLKCIPHSQVQKKLRVSFDGLKDVIDQQIFLDIACFFIGKDRNDVIQILNGCGFFADIGITVLIERSLVTVDHENKLRMHDLLRDMGRQMIYEESPFDPEMRSRLWRREEVLHVLSTHKGTEAVMGLTLEFPIKNKVCLDTKAFKKMNKLRLLRLSGVKLKGDFKYLSGDLRWLYWRGFPLTCTPAEFQQGNLVSIEFKYSNLKQVWTKSQMLGNLKILNLSHSLDLIETPDFSYLPNLEKLVLKDCPSLSAVSRSIGSLHELLMINLRDCTGLRKLPRSIYKLKSLETLILSGCSMIDKLEEDLEQMESLTTLLADKTAITKVPFSIARMKSIGYISFRGFEGFSRDIFPSLIWSWMSPRNNVISLVQTSVFISSLGTFKDLLKLRSICVESGSEIQLTRDVSRILNVLIAPNCHKLEGSASATTSQISDMHASPLIDDCLGHFGTSGPNNYLKSLLIQMGTKCAVSNIAEDSILQAADGTWDLFLLPCDNKSNRSTFGCKGCSLLFDVPTMKGSNLKSMILSVDYYSSPENITSDGCLCVLIKNYTKRTIQAYKRDTLTSFEDEDWKRIKSNLEPGNKVVVMVVFEKGFIVNKTTISLLYDEPLDKKMERCRVVNEDVIVSGNDDNNVSVSGDDNEVINPFGKETMNHMQITKHGDGLCVDVVGPIQLVPHDLDQPVEAVAEEIHPAEEQHDQEHHVPPPECEPEQHATVASATIEPTLGAQILDAIRELRADFVRHEHAVTARFNAVEVRLEELADVVTQIQRDVES